MAAASAALLLVGCGYESAPLVMDLQLQRRDAAVVELSVSAISDADTSTFPEGVLLYAHWSDDEIIAELTLDLDAPHAPSALPRELAAERGELRTRVLIRDEEGELQHDATPPRAVAILQEDTFYDGLRGTAGEFACDVDRGPYDHIAGTWRPLEAAASNGGASTSGGSSGAPSEPSPRPRPTSTGCSNDAPSTSSGCTSETSSVGSGCSGDAGSASSGCSSDAPSGGSGCSGDAPSGGSGCSGDAPSGGSGCSGDAPSSSGCSGDSASSASGCAGDAAPLAADASAVDGAPPEPPTCRDTPTRPFPWNRLLLELSPVVFAWRQRRARRRPRAS